MKALRLLVSNSRASTRGQVVPLVALMMVVLLGAAALAIDVSRKYSEVRFDRSIADAASLAGAQDLQTGTSRIGDTTQARTHALQVVANQLRGSVSACDPTADVVDCSVGGTTYRVSVRTPAPSCTGGGTSTCGRDHSVQVTIHQTSFGTTFARVLGQTTWDIRTTSVAGLNFGAKYALMTLQPPDPRPNFTDANLCKNIDVNGTDTVLNISQGDIGSNTSASTTNSGEIRLASGYYIYHFDDITNASCGVNSNPTWSTDANGNPQGQRFVAPFIQDPDYYYARFTGLMPMTQATGAIPCTDASVNFPTDTTTVTFLTPVAGGTRTCYRPGVYSGGFTVANKDVAYLAPGAYEFLGGLTVNSLIAGGLVSNQPGVVLVFPKNQSFIANNNNSQIILNTGNRSCSTDSCRATAAVDSTNTQVKTPAGITISVEILRDGACFSGTNPLNTGLCDVNQNTSVKLTSALLVQIAGIIYGPSDNMNIVGGSSQQGLIGQIVSWTVKYTGHSTLNQAYPGGEGAGLLRIDPACSAPGEPCVLPAGVG